MEQSKEVLKAAVDRADVAYQEARCWWLDINEQLKQQVVVVDGVVLEGRALAEWRKRKIHAKLKIEKELSERKRIKRDAYDALWHGAEAREVKQKESEEKARLRRENHLLKEQNHELAGRVAYLDKQLNVAIMQLNAVPKSIREGQGMREGSLINN